MEPIDPPARHPLQLRSRPPPSRGFSATEAVSRGRSALTRKPLVVLVVLLYVAILAIVLWGVTTLAGGGLRQLYLDPMGQVATQVVLLLLASYLNAGLATAMLEILRGGEVRVATLFRGGRCLLRVAAATFVLAVGQFFVQFVCTIPGVLLAASGVFIGGAALTLVSVLLQVVLWVYVMLGLQFYVHAIVDRDLGPIEALSESWTITDGHRGRLLLFALLGGCIFLAGILALGIGAIVAIAIVLLAQTWIFLRLTGTGGTSLDESIAAFD